MRCRGGARSWDARRAIQDQKPLSVANAGIRATASFGPDGPAVTSRADRPLLHLSRQWLRPLPWMAHNLLAWVMRQDAPNNVTGANEATRKSWIKISIRDNWELYDGSFSI